MVSMYYVQDEDLAEDVVQEFFIDYWEKQRNQSLKTTFQAYAVRAVKNQSISKIRTLNTDDKRLNKFATETYSDQSTEETTEIDQEALQLEVLRLIDQLPTERKKILLMSSKQNLSNQEIANELGISIHTVKSQISKAYAYIRENVQLHIHMEDNTPENQERLNAIVVKTLILFHLLSVGYEIFQKK